MMADLVLIDDDAEVFDLVGASTAPCVLPLPRTLHLLYIDRARYDADLLPGQRDPAAAYAQLDRDIPRSLFRMDGVRCLRAPMRLPLSLVRYCTQAVMALPIELLQTDTVVADGGAPLRIDATATSVRVRKGLVVGRLPVRVQIEVRLHRPVVVVQYRFSTPRVDPQEGASEDDAPPPPRRLHHLLVAQHHAHLAVPHRLSRELAV